MTQGPPFRVEHVGSLLRPEKLLTARAAAEGNQYRHSSGPLHYSELKEIEDEAIRDAVRMQEDVGLRVVTDGDWAGITDVWVSPDHRRRGLALVVMDAMLSWSAERGAGTAYLQVRGDNAPGLALYAGLGFRTHHTYRYLAAPTR